MVARKTLPALSSTFVAPPEPARLELDELWSLVLPINIGSGSRCAARHGKSWRLPQATAAPRLGQNSGSGFPPLFAPVTAALTVGKPLKKCCPTSSLRPVGKQPDKPRTSSAGTTRYDNAGRVLCARPCPFPNRRRGTSYVCDSFSIATISRLSPPTEPLPASEGLRHCC